MPDPGPDAAVSQRWGPPPLNFGGRLLGSPASTPLDFCLSYAALVSAISRRRLSHQNDALNAAVGVLGPLAAAGGLRKDYGVLAGNPSEGFRTELLAGIPSVIFEEAIMWTPGPDVMHRREGFPSWSWAGWSGAIEKPAAMCVRRHKGSPTMTSTKHCFQWMHLARFYVPEFVDLKEEMRKTHRAHMTAFESPASVGRSCFSLLDFDNIPVEPLPTMKYQADPPREHVLLMWAVVFKAQWSAMVRRANTRVYAEHYDSDVVLEVRDGLGNFAGRILCHWPGYPEEPGPAWTEMDLVVARTCGKAHSQEDHLLTDWLIARLGLAGFEQKFWGAKGGWRSHICLENWEPAAPDKADDPFHRWTDRPDARFFYCVLVAWQADGIAERVGIGMILETAIRDAPAPGPRWKEILLA